MSNAAVSTQQRSFVLWFSVVLQRSDKIAPYCRVIAFYGPTALLSVAD